MDAVGYDLWECPGILYAVYFNVNDPMQKTRAISLRIKYVANKIANIKKEIDRCNTKLAVLTAAFPGIRYDDKRLFVSRLANKDSFSCFSGVCSTKASKKKKGCLII